VGNYQFNLSVVLPGAFTRNAKVSRRNFGLKPKTSFTETRGIQMRKFIIIAAIGLLSTAANAGPSRGLSLASNDHVSTPTEQPKTADAPATAVERPKIVAPQEQAKTINTADKPAEIAKPKKKRISTEARVIYELHRHGIYW
jgi:hypothetical protein